MKSKTTILIIVAGILAGAISSWFNEYNQLTVFGISIRLLLAITSFAASFLMSLFYSESNAKIPLLISAGVLMALAGRIIFDLYIDSTSHNLFPFEMLISFSISFSCAFVGSFLASLYKKKKNR
jgi:hypothetical protein